MLNERDCGVVVCDCVVAREGSGCVRDLIKLWSSCCCCSKSVRLWRPWRPWRRMKEVDEDEGVAGLAMLAWDGWMDG